MKKGLKIFLVFFCVVHLSGCARTSAVYEESIDDPTKKTNQDTRRRKTGTCTDCVPGMEYLWMSLGLAAIVVALSTVAPPASSSSR